MGYVEYGIERELVERVKKRLKEPAVKERVQAIADGVTKADLQNRAKVARLLARTAEATDVKLTPRQIEAIVSFVIDQRIDPGNAFHLIKLWAMFR